MATRKVGDGKFVMERDGEFEVTHFTVPALEHVQTLIDERCPTGVFMKIPIGIRPGMEPRPGEWSREEVEMESKKAVEELQARHEEKLQECHICGKDWGECTCQRIYNEAVGNLPAEREKEKLEHQQQERSSQLEGKLREQMDALNADLARWRREAHCLRRFLHGMIDALIDSGLDPWEGLLHPPRGSHRASHSAEVSVRDLPPSFSPHGSGVGESRPKLPVDPLDFASNPYSGKSKVEVDVLQSVSDFLSTIGRGENADLTGLEEVRARLQKIVGSGQ